LPIVAAALRAPEWKLQRAVDLALMKAAPTIQRAAKPAPPKVETASKAAASSKPASPPTIKTAAPEPLRFVAKPFVPSAAAVPNAVPATQRSAATPARSVTALVRSGDPRPDALFQHRGGQGDGSLGAAMASNRAPSVGKRSDTADSKNSAEARAAAARAGTAADTEGDPRGKVSNGARAESEIGAGGAGPAANDGGAAVSNGAAGNDARGSEAGAGGPAGTDAGSAADNTSGGGEKNESDGNGGVISGALGGIGEALGGDGSNPADHADKDQKD
jgi:hypothetical protein